MATDTEMINQHTAKADMVDRATDVKTTDTIIEDKTIMLDMAMIATRILDTLAM
jgi:hypothetical protein